MENFFKFFGLKDDPFRVTPDIEYFYMSPAHKEVLDSLEYLYHSGEGFAVIIGEPGTGKTTTVKKFLSSHPYEILYAYIIFPSFYPLEMLRAILREFGIKTSPNEAESDLFAKLREFLTQKKEEGHKVFIIVDEAQNLPIETMEELRILSNLETNTEKLLQIVLTGQTELEKKINLPQLRQLKERVTVVAKLRNLNYNEMVDYIKYKLEKAGNPKINIPRYIYKLIYKYSGGNFRKINLIMRRTLMAAYVDESKKIKYKHLREALKTLGFYEERREQKKLKFLAGASVILTILLGLVGTFAWFLYVIATGSKEIASSSGTKTVIIEKETPEEPQINIKHIVLDSDESENKAALSPQEEIISFLKKWKSYWERKDFNRYISLYCEDFKWAGGGLEKWKGRKKKAILNKKFIKIYLNDIKIKKINNSKWEVVFIQEYFSDKIDDVTLKKLVLEKTNKNICIKEERLLRRIR
ncbi:ExeA family protein [Persephonella sp.]